MGLSCGNKYSGHEKIKKQVTKKEKSDRVVIDKKKRKSNNE